MLVRGAQLSRDCESGEPGVRCRMSDGACSQQRQRAWVGQIVRLWDVICLLSQPCWLDTTLVVVCSSGKWGDELEARLLLVPVLRRAAPFILVTSLIRGLRLFPRPRGRPQRRQYFTGPWGAPGGGLGSAWHAHGLWVQRKRWWSTVPSGTRTTTALIATPWRAMAVLGPTAPCWYTGRKVSWQWAQPAAPGSRGGRGHCLPSPLTLQTALPAPSGGSSLCSSSSCCSWRCCCCCAGNTVPAAR